MTEGEYKLLEPMLDPLAEKLRTLLESPEFKAVRDALQKVTAEYPEAVSMNLECNLELFDDRREHAVKYLQMGLTTTQGKEPYLYFADSTVQRYVCHGTVCQLPHNYCPECWGEWDFKQTHRTCPECGVELGKGVKILLDSDVCPHCEKGTVSMHQPTCSNCGHTVDMSIVAWG
jgi:hypothetical protein